MRHAGVLVCLLGLPAVIGARPAAAEGGAACLFQCDSQCYGQPGPYCRSGCMARCNSGQGTAGGGNYIPQSRSRDNYAAIAAASTEGNFYGYSFAQPSRAAAERVALAECEAQAGRKGACEIGTWFANSCGAIAIGSAGAWGTDYAATTAQASASALHTCQSKDRSGACHLVKAFCSR